MVLFLLLLVWVLSGEGDGWFWGVEGLRLGGIEIGGFAIYFCCNGLGFAGCGGDGWFWEEGLGLRVCGWGLKRVG